MVNIDVLAPMPTPSTSTAVRLKPGARTNNRIAYARSCRSRVIRLITDQAPDRFILDPVTFLPIAGILVVVSSGVTQTPAGSANISGGVEWKSVLAQSGLLLGIQHSLRMAQPKTRLHLDGPFWRDYVHSLRGLEGWDDGNPVTTNYLGHPFMGAITGFIWIQNDPKGRAVGWNPRSRQYWTSRMRGMAWSAVYSTSFELAPWGEAGIGNVGYDRGTMAFVDLVVTPLGGFGLMVLEDYLDATVIRRIERGGSTTRTRVFRVLLNPSRSLANMLQFKRPSHRDGRPPS